MEPIRYTVQCIWGDYAILLSQDGVENQVALALLPDGVEEGQHLLWENFEYRLI